MAQASVHMGDVATIVGGAAEEGHVHTLAWVAMTDHTAWSAMAAMYRNTADMDGTHGPVGDAKT